MKNRILFAATTMVALLVTGWSAHADTVSFAYQGTVLSCPDTGMPPCGSQLFTGDAFIGSIDVDGNAVLPNGSIGTGAVVDLQFLLGAFIGFNSGNTTPVAGTINLDGAGAVQGGSMAFHTDAIAGAPGSTLSLNFGSTLWTIQALIGGNTVTIASGVGKLTQVPVPGALLMFAPALLGFLGLRRKRA
jgi:hypothetical protein